MKGDLLGGVERQVLEGVDREENGLVASHPGIDFAFHVSLSMNQWPEGKSPPHCVQNGGFVAIFEKDHVIGQFTQRRPLYSPSILLGSYDRAIFAPSRDGGALGRFLQCTDAPSITTHTGTQPSASSAIHTHWRRPSAFSASVRRHSGLSHDRESVSL